eukprot:755982-Hanusia_phi.AAC.2
MSSNPGGRKKQGECTNVNLPANESSHVLTCPACARFRKVLRSSGMGYSTTARSTEDFFQFMTPFKFVQCADRSRGIHTLRG